MEAMSMTGEHLPLFIIFKRKKCIVDWFTTEIELGDLISLCENGWTDNKLCMEWMKECFELFTRFSLRGEYQLLIVDSHASHMSTKFIIFS